MAKAESVVIDGIVNSKGEKGRFEISPLWRGDGTDKTDVVVHFFPNGTNIMDYGDPTKGVVSVAHVKLPATVKTVAQSINMFFKAKKHVGD